jgi:hypothetical protein
MSDEETDLGTSLKRLFLPMLQTPGTIKDWYSHEQKEKYEEKDEVWSDFHLFHGDWIEVINKKEWYESPHVPQIYTDHKKILKQNMQLTRPFESWYQQKVDTGDFGSKMNVGGEGTSSLELPSGNGKYKIEIEISLPGGPPSGENDACLVEYFVKGSIQYDVPGGVSFLPRFIAYPLNSFFKWAFIEFIAEEQIEYDGEFVREKINEYFQYLRKYHGEEPMQAKSRQAVFEPSVEDGVFFQ